MYKEQKHHISYAQTHRGIGEAFMGLQEFKKALEHFKIYYGILLWFNQKQAGGQFYCRCGPSRA